MRAGARRGLAALLLAVALLSGGCWDARDINERSPAIAMSFDITRGAWRVGLWQALLSQSSASQVMGSQAFGRGGSLTDAVKDLKGHLDKALYVGAIKIYLVGPGVLQDRLPEVIDFLRQRVEVDSTSFLIGSVSPAAALLARPDPTASLTALHLLHEFDRRSGMAEQVPPVRLWESWRRTLTPGATNLVPLVAAASTTIVDAGSALVGPDGRLRVTLDSEESAVLRWLMNTPTSTLIKLADGSVTKIMAIRARPRFVGRRQVSVEISLQADGYLVHGLMTSAWRRHVAQETATAVAQRVLRLVRKLQASHADIPGWREAALEAGDEAYSLPQATVHVQVAAVIRPITVPGL